VERFEIQMGDIKTPLTGPPHQYTKRGIYSHKDTFGFLLLPRKLRNKD